MASMMSPAIHAGMNTSPLAMPRDIRRVSMADLNSSSSSSSLLEDDNPPAVQKALSKSLMAGIEKEVRVLFEKSNIDEIRTAESHARKDIEDKRLELRSLIGNRYRDLLESADSIVSMRGASSSLLSTMQSITTQLNASAANKPHHRMHMQRNFVTVPSPSSNRRHIVFKNTPQAIARRTTIEVANSLKVLVEAPERMWSALDDGRHMDATDTYMEARDIYLSLSSSEASIILPAAAPPTPPASSPTSRTPQLIPSKFSSPLLSSSSAPSSPATSSINIINNISSSSSSSTTNNTVITFPVSSLPPQRSLDIF
eukprot:TRINITY_DN9485_c0_g1_i1.p1 TRINITY_DN9485_c0_g1~~TRINITY_DN9485_c0_g1_i1.p1  ORF type:complete len:313 (+),score=88.94 TRINITY_DN9485_c0_g1_i1:72-1010(+)